MSVDPGVGLSDDRPRVRVWGRFAGEIPGIELREGGVEVVKVERDLRDVPLSVSISTMLSSSARKCFGPLVAAREAGTHEDEALSAGRDDGPRSVCDSELGDRPHVCDLASRPCRTPRPPPDGDRPGKVIGQCLSHGVPVAGRKIP